MQRIIYSILLVVIAVFLLINFNKNHPEPIKDNVKMEKEVIIGEIIDKYYQPSDFSNNSGVVVGTGQVIAQSNYQPEKWIFILKLDDDSIITKEVDSKIYYSYEIGDEYKVD